MGTAIVAHARPRESTLKVPPVTVGAPGLTNQSW
jgi:hypothetical protein